MPEVSSIGFPTGGNGPVGPPNRIPPPGTTQNGMLQTRPLQPIASDQVDLSDRARFLDQLRGLPEVRVDRVQAARDAINDGRYDTDERLNLAIDRLLKELNEP